MKAGAAQIGLDLIPQLEIQGTMHPATATDPPVAPERQAFYSRVGSRSYALLWEVLRGLAPPEPRPSPLRQLWSWPETLEYSMEAGGGFLTAGGERSVTAAGDFLIPPSTAFHDHGNDGQGPLIFLDVVDVPTNALCETVFAAKN